MQELLRLRDEGKLNDIQKQWFRDSKPKEELFDCAVDPFELNNLADNPEYKDKLNELRSEMDNWLAVIEDNPDLSEAELIKKLWNGNDEQPVTSKPIINKDNGKVTISCETKGASIGYKIISKSGKTPKSWKIYQNPIELPEEYNLIVKAHRIGYKPSKTIEVQ